MLATVLSLTDEPPAIPPAAIEPIMPPSPSQSSVPTEVITPIMPPSPSQCSVPTKVIMPIMPPSPSQSGVNQVDDDQVITAVIVPITERLDLNEQSAEVTFSLAFSIYTDSSATPSTRHLE
jgi:hypothetical protein